MSELDNFLEKIQGELATAGATFLRVKVTPGAPKTGIAQLLAADEPVLKIKIAAAPERGKANAELEKFLGKKFDCAARVISGFATGFKLVQLKK
ncbi:DUF167 domain-containing protein [bacterium]|jgi:uncharacterized protein YggU (UPF0235/DUF167 family)|nr:DUF167 domain-containing protein [bacterium]MBT6831913.1 DUF167 domain-containing protein [bacterium]MBT6996609.1 DUF167 domain-containing protein [bacterium]MBT7773029.1 DUF167 domain-containing protein [bacterium]